MHRGCFVWTLTRSLAGRRTPRLGPVRVCLCALFFAASGGPASGARFGAPHLFFGRLSFCFARPRPGWGCPFVVLLFACFLSSCFFYFAVPFARPLCLLISLVSGPGCVGPWRCPFASPPPASCFFSFAPPLSPALSGIRPRVSWALALCSPARLFRFPPSPPLYFFAGLLTPPAPPPLVCFVGLPCSALCVLSLLL